MSNIYTFDIETAPHTGYFWGLWKQNIGPGQIKEPTHMLTWAAKKLGKRRMYYGDIFQDDYIERLWHILDAADAVVTYNGTKFDVPHVNREFAERGLGPPSPFAQIDLLQTVRKEFQFPSNRLDYVAPRLAGEQWRKLETGGFELWPAFMEGDRAARKTMRKYNKQDVAMTEAVYLALRPWIKNHPWVGAIPAGYIDDADEAYDCPACGSARVERLRPRRTRCYAIRVVRCIDCLTTYDGKRKKLT